MADAKDQNDQAAVFDLADEPVIADRVFPELSKARAVQRLSDAARIVSRHRAFITLHLQFSMNHGYNMDARYIIYDALRDYDLDLGKIMNQMCAPAQL